jgi:hypothetical protein
MNQPHAKRVTRQLTPEEQARLARQRALVAAELPDLIARDRMRKEAAAEATLSGELRRAVHASKISLAALAQQVGVTTLVLDEFLTGERTLRSDVMDRLAKALGYELQRA